MARFVTSSIGAALSLLIGAPVSAEPNFDQDWTAAASCAAAVPPGTSVIQVNQLGFATAPGLNVAQGFGYKIEFTVDDDIKTVKSWKVVEAPSGVPAEPGVRVVAVRYSLNPPTNTQFFGEYNYYEPDLGSEDKNANISKDGLRLYKVFFCMANFPIQEVSGVCSPEQCTDILNEKWLTTTTRDGVVNTACSCNFDSVQCTGASTTDPNLQSCIAPGTQEQFLVQRFQYGNTLSCITFPVRIGGRLQIKTKCVEVPIPSP